MLQFSCYIIIFINIFTKEAKTPLSGINSVTVRRDATTANLLSATTPSPASHHHHNHLPIKLICHLDASPTTATPLIEWQLNGIRINTTSPTSGRFKITGDRLAFNQATTALDDGVYSCCARHPAGTVHSKHNFTMTNGHGSKHGKRHQQQMHDVHGSVNRLKRGGQGAKAVAAQLQVDENGLGVLECDLPGGARNNGGLSVKWMKDGKVLRQVDIDGGEEEEEEEESGSSGSNKFMPREYCKLRILFRCLGIIIIFIFPFRPSCGQSRERFSPSVPGSAQRLWPLRMPRPPEPRPEYTTDLLHQDRPESDRETQVRPTARFEEPRTRQHRQDPLQSPGHPDAAGCLDASRRVTRPGRLVDRRGHQRDARLPRCLAKR